MLNKEEFFKVLILRGRTYPIFNLDPSLFAYIPYMSLISFAPYIFFLYPVGFIFYKLNGARILSAFFFTYNKIIN